MPLVKSVKRAVLSGVRFLGAFGLLRDSAWRQHRLLIVGYHGVSIDDEHLWNPQLYVSPAVLAARLEALRRGRYNVLPLGEAVERLATDDLPPRSVALTFDDGFADFALRAYPLLAQYEVPSTVYMTTYYSTFNKPIPGLLCSYLLWMSRRDKVRLSAISPALPDQEFDIRTEAGRVSVHGILTRHADGAGLNAVEKDLLAQRLAVALEVDYQQLFDKRILRLLTPAEIQSLSQSGVDFQLHTHRHRTPGEAAAFSREIDDNRRALAQLITRPAEHFCYPSGVYESAFLGWLRDRGVKSATTCDTGIANARTEPLLLPRLIDTMNLSNIEFESWLTGTGAFLPLRPHRPSYAT